MNISGVSLLHVYYIFLRYMLPSIAYKIIFLKIFSFERVDQTSLIIFAEFSICSVISLFVTIAVF